MYTPRRQMGSYTIVVSDKGSQITHNAGKFRLNNFAGHNPIPATCGK
jgi:hypothetical protein